MTTGCLKRERMEAYHEAHECNTCKHRLKRMNEQPCLHCRTLGCDYTPKQDLTYQLKEIKMFGCNYQQFEKRVWDNLSKEILLADPVSGGLMNYGIFRLFLHGGLNAFLWLIRQLSKSESFRTLAVRK